MPTLTDIAGALCYERNTPLQCVCINLVVVSRCWLNPWFYMKSQNADEILPEFRLPFCTILLTCNFRSVRHDANQDTVLTEEKHAQLTDDAADIDCSIYGYV